MELVISVGSVLVAGVQVSGEGVLMKYSVPATQSKSSSQACEDTTGSAHVVPPLVVLR